MGFLRTIGRFIAGFLVLFGITLFIVSYLGSKTLRDKLHSQEGDSPDRQLMSQRIG